jgi:hypothetical protein
MSRKINFKPVFRRRPRAVALAGTIYNWSIELDFAHATVTKRLRIAGIQFKKGQKIPARHILAALTGGYDMSRARIMKARARILELKLAQMERDLIPWVEVERTISTTCIAVRQRLDSLPAEAAYLCNPSDPEHARKVLEEWLARSLPIIRAQTAILKAAADPQPT